MTSIVCTYYFDILITTGRNINECFSAIKMGGGFSPELPFKWMGWMGSYMSSSINFETVKQY